MSKHSSTPERWLQNDVASLCEAISWGDISIISWIKGTESPAEGLTRSNVLRNYHTLFKLIDTNFIQNSGEGQVKNISINN